MRVPVPPMKGLFPNSGLAGAGALGQSGKHQYVPPNAGAAGVSPFATEPKKRDPMEMEMNLQKQLRDAFFGNAGLMTNEEIAEKLAPIAALGSIARSLENLTHVIGSMSSYLYQHGQQVEEANKINLKQLESIETLINLFKVIAMKQDVHSSIV